MRINGNEIYEFGPYRLSKQTFCLLRDAHTVPLNAKAMEILIALVDRGGEIVSKVELMETLWPDSYVEEGNLTQNVFLLRKALGETAHNHNYIVTVPGKGYRFAAEVREVAKGSAVEDATRVSLASPAAATAIAAKPLATRKKHLALVASVFVLAAATAFLGWQGYRHR